MWPGQRRGRMVRSRWCARCGLAPQGRRGCRGEQPTRQLGEGELRDACRAGRVLDGGPRRRPIDAELLRRWCLEHRDEVDPRGIRLRHAEVVGVLDLAGVSCRSRRRWGQRQQTRTGLANASQNATTCRWLAGVRLVDTLAAVPDRRGRFRVVLVASSVNLDDSSTATQIVLGQLPRPRRAAVGRRLRRRWVSVL
jgi:hypothetical protein